MPDIDTLTRIMSPHYYEGRLKPIRLAVMHTPETDELPDTAENVARYFQGERRASTHLVGDNNSVVRCVDDEDTAFGAERANADGLHYELAGRAAQTAEQWADDYSAEALVLAADCFSQWCDRYHLPKRRLTVPEIRAGLPGICGHGDVYAALGGTAVRTDPGAHFPWELFIALVNGTPDTPSEDSPMIFHVTINGNAQDPKADGSTWYLAVIGYSIQAVSASSVAKSSLPRVAVSPEVYKAQIEPACSRAFFTSAPR